MVRDDLRSPEIASSGKTRVGLVRAANRFKSDTAATYSQELAELARWFIERELQAHFVVDDTLRVLVMNTAAERLLQSTPMVTVTAGKVAFEKARPRLELTRILAGQKDCSSFPVRAAGGPMTISVRRIHSSSGRALLMIAIIPAWLSDCQRLRAELGLSRAESEIAIEIFQGLSLVSVARGRGASINTVKTQVRNLFRKCKVHSQVSLARRISEILLREAAPTALSR